MPSLTRKIFFLFSFFFSFSLATYEQWMVERNVQAFPETKKEAQLFSAQKIVLPERCPIPLEKIHLYLKSSPDEIWVGGKGEFGVAFYSTKEKKWRYFGPLRYLLSGNVQKMAFDDQGNLFVKTEKGISKIYRQKMTLEKKAKFFLERLQARHIKDGFVRFLSLDIPGEPEKGGILHPADNDGLWTSLYIMAESFRYAVTKDPLAKKFARQSLEALMWLQDITGNPGFPARAIVRKEASPASQRYGGEWHLSADGLWEWKGDTSSDELDGHFAAYSLYHVLVADQKEKGEIKKYVTKIMDHIIEHNWYLVDLDGKPTTWGKWNPQLFRETLWGKTARGLNALEILSYLNTAYHISKEWKYRKAFYELLMENYDQYIQKVKITTHPQFVNHSDDELAALVYYPFFQYEKDPLVLDSAQKGFKKWCEAELPERSPWFNALCCAFSEDKSQCHILPIIETLQEIPMDTLNWEMKNSIRADVQIGPPDRHRHPQLTAVLPISERCFLRWNGNPYRGDSCGKGEEEGDGVHFLLPYWLNRYLNYIK